MKKKYSLDRILPGSRFTADAFSEGDIMFAPAGVAIRAKDIEGLKRWGIGSVFSEGQLEAPADKAADNAADSAAGPSASIRAAAASAAANEGRAKAGGSRAGLAAFADHALYAAYTDMIDRLKRLMDSIAQGEKVEPKNVDKLSQDLVQLVREKDSIVVSAILSADVQGYDLARAGVNCAILSVVVGQTMKLPPHRLVHLASGALLHDVGMLRVPEAIIKKKGTLSPEEAQKMRAHPLLSYRIVIKELQYPDDVGLVGLQHHERWDGDGYPRRTAGQDIDLLARIVSVADAFEAMVSQKPYRNSMIGYAAIKNLLSDNSRRFDPDVLKAFVRSMGIYPIGSIVVLNNAAIAKVVDTHADAPLRPKLRVIVDEFGKHFKDESGDSIDLLAEKTLFIARAVDPRELAAQA
ncbi:MAG: HD-GYP domain-containing protein [Spirochaetes bacterium]|nr:HD-GYP domain-containing protein [Spirochaetota bacterium]MBU1079130.1 HD-GYP domain-containing protein [Spirochaetota bacterium]